MAEEIQSGVALRLPAHSTELPVARVEQSGGLWLATESRSVAIASPGEVNPYTDCLPPPRRENRRY